MRVGSLFSGIEGFGVAAEWCGHEVIWQSEIDPYCCALLKERFPGVPNLGDITQIDWSSVERPDIITGGFPCQDISYAGKGAGLAGARSGLWYEYARAIRELGPRYVIVENVRALLTRGIDAVLGTLADLGYDAEWSMYGASDVGAPHRRQRLWILAYQSSAGRETWGGNGMGDVLLPFRDTGESAGEGGRAGVVADTHSGRGQQDSSASQLWTGGAEQSSEAARNAGRSGIPEGPFGPGWWASDPADAMADADSQRGGRLWQSVVGFEQDRQGRAAPAPDGNAGTPRDGGDSAGRAVSYVGRVADGIPARVDRLRGLGNAIVPTCAVPIFQRIQAIEEQNAKQAV